MNISLESFIPIYPDFTKNDSQLLLSCLHEFNELRYNSSEEDKLKRGEYFKHQITASRYVRFQDRVFILDAPGSGKSCKMTLINELIKSKTNYYKNYYFIVMNTLVSSIKNQIINKCTVNKYIDDSKYKKSDVLSSNKIPLSSSYTIMTYGELIKEIKGKTREEIKLGYDYSIYSLDEITYIINNDFTKSNSENEEKIDDKMLELLLIKDMNDIRLIKSDNNYIQLWRFFHCLDNSKIIFASGTPYANRATEFLLLINCLLPLDNQINLKEYSTNIFRYNLKKYEKYFNGLFLYVESSPNVPKARYNGCKINKSYNIEYPKDDISDNPEIETKTIESNIVLYKIELFGYQNNFIYSDRDKLQNNSIDSKYEQCLCFVDQNYNIGERSNVDILNHDLYNEMTTCGMFTEIIRLEEERFIKSKTNNLPGPGYFFTFMKLVSSVILPFIKLFENAGYEVLYENKHFEFIKSPNLKTSITSLTKKKRVVFVNGTYITNVEIREKITQLCGSKENIHGEYVQLLVGSDVLSVGFNIANARGMYKTLAPWNDALDKQTRDRVFREDGSDELKKYEAELIKIKTGEEVNPNSIKLELDLYNFCCFTRHFFINYNEQLDPFKIYHVVGFCDSNKFNIKDKYYDKLIYNYVKIGESPSEKLMRYFNICIYTDPLFDFSNKDVILCHNNLLLSYPVSKLKELYSEGNHILYHENCEFMKNYIPDIYNNECLILIYEDDYIKFRYINMMYISLTENRYITMEKKSFSTKRLFRHSKRFAVDCYNNYFRKYNSNNEDYTINCDYEPCDYTCSSEVLNLNDKSSTSFLYEENKDYMDNYEILYSDDIIKTCKNDIISLFQPESKKKIYYITEIYDIFMKYYKKEYIINMAIYEILIEKVKVKNELGFNRYICSDNIKLFLNDSYNKKLIGVLNNPNYINIDKINGEYISMIEQSSNINEIIELINKLNRLSIKTLIETCFSRIIYRQEKYCDDFICRKLYAIRCHKVNINNQDLFVHNFNTKPEENETNIISNIKKPSSDKNSVIYKCVFINNRIEWVLCNNEKEKRVIQDKIAEKFNNIIQELMNNIGLQYYMSYYNGKYRFTEGNNNGIVVSSLQPDRLKSIIEIINSRYNLGLDISKMNKKEQEKWLIEFFESNNCVIKYSYGIIK